MSIFRTILSKIFPSNHPAVATAGDASAAAPAGTSAAGGAAPASAAPPVDVTKILDDLNAKQAQKLNWRTSIVDLMKLLQLDSSLSSRQALARELNYSGDMNDSASMNIWLHKQVMAKLAANGGKVPDDLKH